MGGPYDVTMAVTQDALDELWDFADPAASAARFADAAARASGPDREELETQRARAYGLQGRFEEADAVLDGVSGATPAVRTRLALERGRVQNSAGSPEAAVPFFLTAAGEARAAGLTFLLVDALHMLAIADSAAADAWTPEAFAVLAQVTDPRTLRWRISLHSNAGWRLVDAGHLDGGSGSSRPRGRRRSSVAPRSSCNGPGGPSCDVQAGC